MKPPVLLCYNLKEDKASKIKQLAMRLRIRIRVVSAMEFHQPLAVLCGYAQPLELPPVPEPFTTEMLVLANFTQPMLTDFLNGFRHGAIPAVTLKAMLTETNQQWDSVTLHHELSQEHAALAASRQAHTEGQKP